MESALGFFHVMQTLETLPKYDYFQQAKIL